MMSDLNVNMTWLLLLALTFISFGSAEGSLSSSLLTPLVLGAGAVKASLIAGSFMELANGQRMLLWSCVLCFGLLSLLLVLLLP